MNKGSMAFVIADGKVEDFFNKAKDTHGYEKLMERCKYVRSKIKRKETCRERLKREYPNNVDNRAAGGCIGCPSQYGYIPGTHVSCRYNNGRRPYESLNECCEACWNQEVIE